MEVLLTATKTTPQANETRVEPVQQKVTSTLIQRKSISSPDDALQILRAQPDYRALSDVLTYLDPARGNGSDFNIKAPSPKAAQLINELIGTILPTFWSALNETSTGRQNRAKAVQVYPVERRLLLQCLRSVTGLGAIVARLRSLIASLGASSASPGVSNSSTIITDLLTVLTDIISQDDFLYVSWIDITNLIPFQAQRLMLWKELMTLVVSSKILSISAEAIDTLKRSSQGVVEEYWIGNGAVYAAWIGRNIATMASRLEPRQQEAWKSLAQLFGRSLSMGYVDQVVENVYQGLLPTGELFWVSFRCLISFMLSHEQRNVLYSMLRILPKRHLPPSRSSEDGTLWQGDAREVGSAAGLISGIVRDDDEKGRLKDELVAWLTDTSGGGIGEDVGIRRAVVVSLKIDAGRLPSVLDKTMRQFGDKLYIKHAPILHQEVNAQILLLSAGYVHRSTPMYLSTLARSSIHLSSISNRLAASSPRARFLGMVVGVAISELVDKPEKRMTFGTDELDNPDARWYKSLTTVQDEVDGSLETLTLLRGNDSKRVAKGSHLCNEKGQRFSAPNAAKAPKSGVISRNSSVRLLAPTTSRASSPSTSKIISIEEIEDDEEDDVSSDDLIPYEKPDSDPEDEDEDPTLVQRNKPTAPLYIRDLIAGLRDSDNYDRHVLSLSTAHTLIRRKASFGTEVLDHAEELATLLTGLSDNFDLENFTKWRLQGMIAILISVPQRLGPWFAKTFFDGDYSMSQRASVLNALGMAARELAGYKTDDGALTGANNVPENAFPSKKLPEKLHKIYAGENTTSPINALAQSLERTMIEPMAVSAADNLSGPNALKVRTFSSRMAVEKARKPPISNKLSKLVAEAFFFPLTGRWWVHMQTSTPTSSHRTPYLLSTYLKTLSLILHASGPSTPTLPQITSEYWDLLLSLRITSITTTTTTTTSSSLQTSHDTTVLEALLFSLLTLLETNTNKRNLAETHSKQLLETREWVGVVFENTSGGDEEGERVRMLAASVLVRTGEVVEEFQRLMMGDLVGF
ncbi:MAG: telomere binding protein [Candelina mexicana]|nr:MAG: telomere binding protein [Candelina mexicana]